ncbi:MAG: hypothetical protein JXA42_24935 [Anaerolineales bacterium]|nr:hypothetical protein [Anaerolineales bacterium]
MKRFVCFIPLAVLLLGCNLTSPTVTPQPVCTPPPCRPDEVYHCPGECPGGCGTICAIPTPDISVGNVSLYDGCAFTLSYPAGLIEDGSGWVVFFTSQSADDVNLHIQARRENGATAEAVAGALVTQITGRDISPGYDPVVMTDQQGERLQGAEAEFVSKGEHLRVLVVVRPETLLGNLSPDDVVYEIVARSPEPDWPQWEPLFDVVFRTFQPRDCGGV